MSKIFFMWLVKTLHKMIEVEWIPQVFLEKWNLTARKRPGPLDCGFNALMGQPAIELDDWPLGIVERSPTSLEWTWHFSLLTEFSLGNHQHRTMEAHELFQYFRMPELADFRQYVRTLPTNTLMGVGAFAALTTFWYATRPKALRPPCDLSMQSVEVPVSGGADLPCGFSQCFLRFIKPHWVIYWSQWQSQSNICSPGQFVSRNVLNQQKFVDNKWK